MQDIIKRILEIDREAKEKMSATEKRRDGIIAEAEAEKEKIIREGIAGAEKKLEKEQAEGRKNTDRRLAEIETEKNAEIARLEGTYDMRRKEWEDKIFKAVING